MSGIFTNPVVIGTAAGVFTSFSLIPQLVKIVKEKKAEAISLGMLFVLFCGVGLWIYYGVIKHDLPIIITNSFSMLVNMAIIFFSMKYQSKESSRK